MACKTPVTCHISDRPFGDVARFGRNEIIEIIFAPDGLDGLTFSQVRYKIRQRLVLRLDRSDLCYTFNMDGKALAWRNWADTLRRRGLGEAAAVLLEAGGPLNLIAAQLVYLSQPLFSRSVSSDHLEALAHLLEEPEQTQSFVSYLREGTPR